MPELARTRSEREDDFLYLCQRFAIPLPQVNTVVHGIEVDCHWPELGLIVELDGDGNHATGAQRNRDQRRALELRAHGVPLIRYTHDQVNRHSQSMARDVAAAIERCRGLS